MDELETPKSGSGAIEHRAPTNAISHAGHVAVTYLDDDAPSEPPSRWHIRPEKCREEEVEASRVNVVYFPISKTPLKTN